MKKQLCIVVVACLLVGFLLTGCQQKAPEVSEPDYSSLIVPPVDLSIADCVNEQSLSAILGYSVTLLGLYEDGSQAVYQSEDGACMVVIHMLNQTRAGFDGMISELTIPYTLQEGMGEVACWYGEPPQLMLYSSGYAVDVAVTCSELDLNQNQACVRQIAESILQKLPRE